MIPIKNNYSSNEPENTRVKVKIRKKTVGITLPTNLVKRARKNNLNLSRITEQTLISILDYLEPQNDKQTSVFLSTGSFLKESVMVPRAGLEPATTRSSASPSTLLSRVLSQTELPRRHSTRTTTGFLSFLKKGAGWCRGPDLNRRQLGLQLHPQLCVLSRVLSQAELPRRHTS